MFKKAALTGKRFGLLEVIKEDAPDKWGHTSWLCKCDCGNTKVVTTSNLNNGKTASCGCYHIKMIKEKNSKHHMVKTRLYAIWSNMLNRVRNKNHPRYKDYGGRGITVCDRWLDFLNFYEDMNKSYYEHCLLYGIKQTTLDRQNNDGNYEPLNCRWATYKVQRNNNKRKKV